MGINLTQVHIKIFNPCEQAVC
uniref:Uncharacterized protein n=1 Tax=Arundo donax TaxID=35708 RepID=A0A0A9ET77_ARUDO